MENFKRAKHAPKSAPRLRKNEKEIKLQKRTEKQRIIELEYRVNLLAIILFQNDLISESQYQDLMKPLGSYTLQDVLRNPSGGSDSDD